MDGPEHRQEDVLGQVHGILHVAGLAVNEPVNLVVVGPDQMVRRRLGPVPLHLSDPFPLLIHPVHRLSIGIFEGAPAIVASIFAKNAKKCRGGEFRPGGILSLMVFFCLLRTGDQMGEGILHPFHVCLGSVERRAHLV